MLLKILVDKSIQVIAPNGESKSESPSVPSLKPSFAFTPGIEATQMPNNKLEVANKNPTANTDLYLMKEEKFLSMKRKNGIENLQQS